MSFFTTDLARSCTLCVNCDSPVGFNRACWYCDYDHKLFSLDKKKLEEEVKIGLMSKKTAEKIIERNRRDEGIPGQLRLTEGDDV